MTPAPSTMLRLEAEVPRSSVPDLDDTAFTFDDGLDGQPRPIHRDLVGGRRPGDEPER